MKLYCGKYNTKTYEFSEVVEITEGIFLINGYDFGDRILEDVMFEVTFKDTEIISIKVEEDSESYFETLNTKMYLKSAKKYAQHYLDGLGDEVDIPERLQKKYLKTKDYFSYLKSNE